MLSSIRKMYEIYYFMKKITLIIMEGAQFDQSISRERLEKWNRILGIICLLISILTSIKLYYQKASVRTDAF